MEADTIAKLGSYFDTLIKNLPAKTIINSQSKRRMKIAESFKDSIPLMDYTPPVRERIKMWGLDFQSGLMNSAGVFTSAKDYHVAAMQGAGAFLGPTTTFNYRDSSSKINPILQLPRTGALISKSEFPNGGFQTANEAANIQRVRGVPFGWSFALDYMDPPRSRLLNLANVMSYFAEKAKVDFMELDTNGLDFSSLDAQNAFVDLEERLEYIMNTVIVPHSNMTGKVMPVIVKFSNDTKGRHIPKIIDSLYKFGYSGVNFGGPVTNPIAADIFIDPFEQKLYNYYMTNFGGNISGKPLNEISENLSALAVSYLRSQHMHKEFHVFRSGGVGTLEDIRTSQKNGVSMNQWNAGYFQHFEKHGHHVYKKLFSSK